MVSNRRHRKDSTGRKAALRAVRADEPRASLYDEVTAKIIGQLEAGIFP